MKIELHKTSFTEKPVLEEMFHHYLNELLVKDHREAMAFFDRYWMEKERLPYFIYCDRKMAGFVLLNEHFEVLQTNNSKAVSEFYITPDYRRKGIGSQAAIETFEKFHGHWEVRQMISNKPAISFWRKVIDKYTNSEYLEQILQERGCVVQTFEN